MCGICGIYNEKNLRVATDMLESIRHRGPDSFSTTLFGGHSLGECGLNIVSSENDRLPLIDCESNIALLYNGEIYNYREIKKILSEEGHSFESNSDSEVIIPLYKKYGTDFVRHLKGMFAIVIIDENTIILARDRFGIKPLFYTRVGDRIIFGSEMKALLQHSDVPAELDMNALEELSVFGYVCSEEMTPIRSIRQVPPGSVISFDGENIKKHVYYETPKAYYLGGTDIDYESSVSTLRELLYKTIATFQKHGDHDIGIYLSGGLDSSLMAMLSYKYLGRQIDTYTLYDSDDAPDRPYASVVSRAIHANHHEILVSAADCIEELPNFIYHYETVVCGGVFDIYGALAFQLLSRHISKRHKVALTGEGADELFGGYYWVYTHPLGFSDRIRKRAANLPIESDVTKYVETLFPSPENEDVYRRNLFDLLMKAGLSNYHLWSVDRSCSSFGFEARPPYLFDDIAEFSLSLPIDFKVQGKTATKRILRDAAIPYLEEYNLNQIVSREKYGMPAAVGRVSSELESMANDLVPDGYIKNHPYARFITSPMEACMFDLFYYSIIHKRGSFDGSFSIHEFYKERLNESMYNK